MLFRLYGAVREANPASYTCRSKKRDSASIKVRYLFTYLTYSNLLFTCTNLSRLWSVSTFVEYKIFRGTFRRIHSYLHSVKIRSFISAYSKLRTDVPWKIDTRYGNDIETDWCTNVDCLKMFLSHIQFIEYRKKSNREGEDNITCEIFANDPSRSKVFSLKKVEQVEIFTWSASSTNVKRLTISNTGYDTLLTSIPICFPLTWNVIHL